MVTPHGGDMLTREFSSTATWLVGKPTNLGDIMGI